MNFTRHITPVDFREHDQYREEKALAALVSCAREIQSDYTISGRFKLYRQNMESVTVIIGHKHFTTRGKDSLYESCTHAIYHVLDSYVQFSDLKKEKDRMLAERNKLCKTKKVSMLIPVKGYN
jgi:hypothetical protein